MVVSDGTIQRDVSEEEVQQVVSRRDLAMAGIEERLDEQRERETVPLIKTTDDEVKLVEDPQKLKVRVKVDGVEKELPLSEVVSSYQKNEVASERLRQSSQRLRELDARERNVLDREQQIQLATATLSTNNVDADVDDDELKAALNLLVEGDTDTAAKALREIIGKGRQQTTPGVDTAKVVAEVKESIKGDNVWVNFLRDNPEFREEYDDQGQVILSKERQYGDFVFIRDFKPKVESGEISYQEALIETAKTVRETLSPSLPTVEQVSGKEKRQQRKDAIDNLPIAAGAVAVGAKVEPEETRSDIIADMRKSRGLAA